MVCNKGSNGNIKPSNPHASRWSSPLPAAPLATSVIQSQGVRACSRAHQHMESRSLLNVIMRRLCSLLAGLCALSSHSDGCWMFRLVVTASPWDQGDLWPLRNGQTWKQKQRPFVRVKGKPSARLKMKKRRWGCFNSQGIIIWPFQKTSDERWLMGTCREPLYISSLRP